MDMTGYPADLMAALQPFSTNPDIPRSHERRRLLVSLRRHRMLYQRRAL